MQLTHVTLDQLKISPLNVRKKGGKDIADILPSIRSLGIIQPLLVRSNCEGFEVVAGQRRFNALTKLAEEGIERPVPVAIMEDGDDAKAIEASLAENVTPLPMDEIDQYKAFAALRDQDIEVADIAARFGVTERLVNQRLAISAIIPPILNAYRRNEVTADTLRTLTMATPKQQKAWWKLVQSDDEYAPVGDRLREWLFGGAEIPVSNALFDVAAYDGAITSDLFEGGRYFTDVQKFWTLQNTAIAEAKQRYLDAGWKEVVVLDAKTHFRSWEHEKRGKKKGGKVFIAVTRGGEVTCHEGFVSAKEAKQAKAAAEKGEVVKAARPELTKAMQNYLGLHRHAAVRTELLAQRGIALRLAVAHIIAGSGLWTVEAEDQRTDNAAIADSLAASSATAGFVEEMGRVRALLGIDAEDDKPVVCRVRPFHKGRSLADIFQSLLGMDDADVVRVLTYVMAETLEAHTDMVETLGALFGTDMGQWWKPDQAFFDLMRDKEALNAMVAEIAGKDTAVAHVTSTAKVQKKIIADCLDGTRKVDAKDWLPGYMRFPAQGYTGRFASVEPVFEDDADTDDEAADDIGYDEAA